MYAMPESNGRLLFAALREIPVNVAAVQKSDELYLVFLDRDADAVIAHSDAIETARTA